MSCIVLSQHKMEISHNDSHLHLDTARHVFDVSIACELLHECSVGNGTALGLSTGLEMWRMEGTEAVLVVLFT